ncbi:MAG: hypothetical protein WDM79_10975 [Terricaulis sp.]
MRAILAGCGLMLLAFTASASAQAPEATPAPAPTVAEIPRAEAVQLGRLFMATERTYAQDGVTLQLAGGIAGALVNAQSDAFEATISIPGEYTVIGVCDLDCSNLDIRVLDEHGGLIAEDTAPDDFPIVELMLSGEATVRVQVTMLACAQEPCYFGANLYRR